MVILIVPVGLVLVVISLVVVPVGLVLVIVLVVVLLVGGSVLGVVVDGVRGLHVLFGLHVLLLMLLRLMLHVLHRLMLHLHLHGRILVHRGRLVGHHRLMPHRGGLVHHSGGHVGRLRGRPHGGRPLGLGHPRGRRGAAATSSTRSERRGGRGHVDCRPLVGHGVGDRGQGS